MTQVLSPRECNNIIQAAIAPGPFRIQNDEYNFVKQMQHQRQPFKIEDLQAIIATIEFNNEVSDKKISAIVGRCERTQQKLHYLLQNVDSFDEECLANDIIRSGEGIMEAIKTLKKLDGSREQNENYDFQINALQICNWLAHFLKGNILLEQANYQEACKIFVKLTDPKQSSFILLKKILDGFKEQDLTSIGIYNFIPREIIDYCEIKKTQAYCNIFETEGKLVKLNNIVATSLEKSFATIRDYQANREIDKKKLYQPLIDYAKSHKLILPLLNISGELIESKEYDSAIECLEVAKNELTREIVGSEEDIGNIQAKIVYNLTLANFETANYESAYETLAQAPEWIFKKSAGEQLTQLKKKILHKLSDDYLSETKMIKIISGSDPEQVSALIEKEPLLLKAKIGDSKNTIIHFAQNKAIIDLLIEKGSSLSPEELSLNTRNKFGETVFHKLYMDEKTELATNLILEYIRSADEPMKKILVSEDNFGNTLLHFAVSHKDKGAQELVAKLLEINSDPNAHGTADLTPLHVASATGNTDILAMLINCKGNINIRNHDQATLLHSACQGIVEGTDCWDTIKLLLEEGKNQLEGTSEFEGYPFNNGWGKEPREILDEFDWTYAERFDDMLSEYDYYSDNESSENYA